MSMKGKVVKKAIKYLNVDCTMHGGSVWRVPAGALRKVA